MIWFNLRKDLIIFNMVIMTNVFSCDGVNNWNFFIFMSLCGSRLVDHNATILVGGGWKSDIDGFNNEGLRSRNTLFL